MFQALFKAPINALVLSGAMIVGLAGMQPAYSASDSSTVTTPSCKKKHAWDKRRKKCVKVKKTSKLSDDNIYEVARDLAYSKRYEEAITILALAKNQQDPRILNYLGYSTRKSGDVQNGLKYYQAAIAADPDYTLARSYMGEAFLQLGQREKAIEQLAQIKARCAGLCLEYAALEAAIQGKKLNTRASW